MFFLNADNPDKKEYIKRLSEEEGGIMEAKKTLDRISSDWVLWKREFDRDVIESDRNSELHYAQEQGLKQGLSQGISQGAMQAKKDTACSLKKLGVSIQIIVQSTGLSESEIAGL